jgi:hypothetical protein
MKSYEDQQDNHPQDIGKIRLCPIQPPRHRRAEARIFVGSLSGQKILDSNNDCQGDFSTEKAF